MAFNSSTLTLTSISALPHFKVKVAMPNSKPFTFPVILSAEITLSSDTIHSISALSITLLFWSLTTGCTNLYPPGLIPISSFSTSIVVGICSSPSIDSSYNTIIDNGATYAVLVSSKVFNTSIPALYSSATTFQLAFSGNVIFSSEVFPL